MFAPDIRHSRDNGNPLFEAQTRAAVKRGLAQHLDALGELIIRDIIYPDTVVLLSKHPVSPGVVQKLEKTTRGGDEIVVEPTKAFGYRAALRIHQPLMATIALATKHLPGHIVSRCDIAIDWLTRDRDDADTLKNESQRIGTQPRRGRRSTVSYHETAYWHFGPTPTRRNIVAYSTRPSKIPPYGPCAHIDLRYFTARMCRQRGIKTAADLLKFDLNKLDLDFRYSAICWKLTPKRLDEQARECARRAHERALQDRKQGRRPLVAHGWVRLRGLVERYTLYEFYDDKEWSGWADLAQAPVQDVFDRIPFLRDTAVHIDGKALVKSNALIF